MIRATSSPLPAKGSTITAAKSLKVSQSTVHRRLEQLQARIGGHLVVRHATGYRLTELGTELVPWAERAEAAMAAFARFATATDTGLAGTIRLTCADAVGFRLVKSGLLDAFQLRHPGVRVELLMSDRFLVIAKGEADVAIRAGRQSDESLVGRKLVDIPWGLFASSDYVGRYGSLKSLDHIAGHRVIELEGAIADTAPGRWMSANCGKAKVAGHCDSVTSALMSVKSGVGIAPLPIPLGSADADLRLLLTLPNITMSHFLLTHPDLRRMPRIKAFFDFMATETTAVRHALTGAK
jgi:DNA-binding transcriptional LysR family regulator